MAKSATRIRRLPSAKGHTPDPRAKPAGASDKIRIIGARQNNLRGIDVSIPLGSITAVTGVSGSGKSSLAFDTLYAEGQRRYVESFSPYARQFMDRMDRPDVERVDGVLPAVAIDQKNAIKASRSTVGTVTELTDFIKLLYAQVAQLHCAGCGEPVRSETPTDIADALLERDAGRRALVTFEVPRCRTLEAVRLALDSLQQEGYRRLLLRGEVREIAPSLARELRGEPFAVVLDRVQIEPRHRSRLVESIEAALERGQGSVTLQLYPDADWSEPRRFSRGRHCASCDKSYPTALPNHFSFNSPLGACSSCNGFGAVIDLDLDLVIPDPRLSLEAGAIRPWSSESTSGERADLRAYCRRVGVPLDVPWERLEDGQREGVVEGDDGCGWYGIRGWFAWLERRTYKMHVRVLLSRYRAYRRCPQCKGARLQPFALLHRLAGLDLAQLYRRDLASTRAFFDALDLPPEQEKALSPVLGEIRSRLRYLCEVGLGYLTLDRQSRTLSGGEVQRVNLTTAIGSGLVNTLYVLDEPSVGLHPRDNDRLFDILERLRANRNTIVVVEHDEAIIRRCDHLIDIGPGPGEAGGEVVFAGTPSQLRRARSRSVTARCLYPKPNEVSERTEPRREVSFDDPLVVVGASEHNLDGIDVSFPRQALSVVTGVSGSGKSTLLEQVLYRGLMRQRGQPIERPGAHDRIEGGERFSDVVLVTQAPVGTTPRSNPATYVKAFEPIRKLFAAQPQVGLRGLSPASFSFNVPGGRCDACDGNGYERIEMQFLSDRFVSCEKCNGHRFKPEVLSVKLDGRSIHDVLELTVDSARELFADSPDIARPLAALAEVGLGYLRLGQPLNTLSGGESQRLKLAGHLAIHQTRDALFLLDEPTTGLHLNDVALLIENLHRLVDQANTVIVIEHHLDLIAAADWVIDLGPEGGDAGGRVVTSGSPATVARNPESYTGRYLAEHVHVHASGRALDRSREGGSKRRGAVRFLAPPDIVVRGARVHNLRDINLRVPRGKLVAISGPSGSGKSSLAFDVLFAEGQRRFIDCLSPYARQYVQQLGRPDIDELLGVPPTVSISQRTSRGGRKSTVATVTEIYHYLRLLYARIGVQHCTGCGARVSGLEASDLAQQVCERHAGQEVLMLAPAVRGRKGFHRELFKRARARGHEAIRVDGKVLDLDEDHELARYREHDVDYVVGRVRVGRAPSPELIDLLESALSLGEGTVHLLSCDARKAPRGRRRDAGLATYSQHRYCASCGIGFEPPDPRLFSFNSSEGACPACSGTGVYRDPEAIQKGRKGRRGRGRRPTRPKSAEVETLAAAGRLEQICDVCDGSRLDAAALGVRLGGRTIAELVRSTPEQLNQFISELSLSPRQHAIGEQALQEVMSRCRFLETVGLGYLTLDRGAHTLSGGEAQRVRLAAQLSADLSGVLYVLDEPTIGLHPSDNERLLGALERLVQRGNTVVIVEHDEETIRRADYLVDLGPGGGAEGGTLVAAGPREQVLSDESSLTARSFALPLRERAVYRARVVDRDHPQLTVSDVEHHNLQRVSACFPLSRLSVVTGVSGSGKSSLVREVLGEGLRRVLAGKAPLSGRMGGVEGLERVREIDQSPIGKTPASTPATYVGLHDQIRRLFAGLPEARVRGYQPGRFSFNVTGGRCEHCSGQGQIKHEMSFLPDVYVPCESCEGRRYNDETLLVRYREHSIADVLRLTVSEAVQLFAAVPKIHRPLVLLQDVGLGYLQLGQPSNTLSGGEAQRVKLVEELQKAGGRGTVYLLDEPSTGLHAADLTKLLEVLQQLVDRGDTVVVIEHNLDVIASADWIVDLGPGGGEAGGRVLYQGVRDGLLKARRSPTAPYLRKQL
jgi:excinuclease ABC subunit A